MPLEPPKPLDPPTVPFALAGMAAFALVGLVLLLNRDWLTAHGHESWLAICAAGVVWGIPGLLTMIVHDRHRKARRS